MGIVPTCTKYGYMEAHTKDIHDLEDLFPIYMNYGKSCQWNCQDLRLMWLTLSRKVVFNIVKEKTTSGLLKALSNMFEKPSAMNKVYLMRRLFNLQMSETGSVSDHIRVQYDCESTQFCGY